jgi:hypothetical protein
MNSTCQTSDCKKGTGSLLRSKRCLSPFCLTLFFALSGLAAADDAPPAAAPPSFRSDVMPVFFRAGCNAGTCHGSARGKDGFMLSLFGYDPKGDYDRVVSDITGRRVNTAIPEESLLLLKAIGAVPHTGGKLFERDTEYYKTLHRWIAAGAPDDSVMPPEVVGISLPKQSVVFKKIGGNGTARVTATYSDGSSRDVTGLARFFSNNPSVATIDNDGMVTAAGPGDTNVFARYSRFTVGAEVVVLPAEKGFVWPDPPTNNFIDTLVFDRLHKLRIIPSELCDDETFLRRITLDLVARPPTVEEYHAFMADNAKDKRAKKIDELLATDDFADYQAAIWGERLRVMGGNYSPDATVIKAANQYTKWIKAQFRTNRPLNAFVSDMVSASGSNISNGPVNLYTMLVHKPRVEPKPLAADFSQLFLGVQIQCAECHNHPFDRWTMNDYYGFVSFFTGMQRKPGVEPREKRIFWDDKAAPAVNPVDGQGKPAKVLGAVEPVGGAGDPREALASWLTSPDNELFATNLANRIWAQFLGRGIIDPVDDIRVSNPPVNAPLMDALAKRLVELKFDLRGLVRDICNSRVYQLSTKPTPSNAGDTRQFSHAHLRKLRADVLLDSVVAVTGVPRQLPDWPLGTRAIDYYPRSSGGTGGPNSGDPFFATFGRSTRGTICACETKMEPTLSQAMHLNVGDTMFDRPGGQLRDRVAASDVIKKLIDTKSTPEDILDELFIRTLCRRPTNEEMAGLRAMVGENGKAPAVYEDILWSLLNATEFNFNH